MKKYLSLLLALLLTVSLLGGCESGLDEEYPAQPPQTTAPLEPEISVRQLYYDYLRDVHIPEVGLASLTAEPWVHCEARGGVEYNAQHLLDVGCGGLLSAVVRDFDLDGDEDMVTFYMTAMPHNETWPAIFNQKHVFPDHVVSMSYFTLDNGQITLKDSYPCAIMLDGLSWGPIRISMEQLEDGIYIRCFSSATDYTTYGASPTTIFHIAGDKFVFDYISGIHYGQGTMVENPNLLMNTTNINPSDYTFDSLKKNPADVDPNGDEENRWIYYGVISDPDSSDRVSYTGVDYTGLRIILEQGIDAFPHEPLPQGGKKPPNPYLLAAEELGNPMAEFVATQTGCNFNQVTTYQSDGSTQVSIRYETEQHTVVSIAYDGETGKITRISIVSNVYPLPQEWQDVKDAVLQYPLFGFTSEDIAPFLGKFKDFSSYTNGKVVTGAKIQAFQVTDTTIRILFDK